MATTVNATLKHKRGTEASIPILKDGQIYLCSDTHKVYKGTSAGENILISDIASLNEKVNKTQVVNNCLTTEEGYIADARQLKVLYDMCKLQECSITWANGVESFIDTATSINDIKCYRAGKVIIAHIAIKLIAQVPSRQAVFTINDFSSPIGLCAGPAQFDSGESGYITLDGAGNLILDQTTMTNGYIRAFIVTVTN